jgi:hypothetical protein
MEFEDHYVMWSLKRNVATIWVAPSLRTEYVIPLAHVNADRRRTVRQENRVERHVT